MATATITQQWVRLPEYMTIEDAARIAECSPWTIRRALKARTLYADRPGSPWGKGWRIKAEDLLRWAKQSRNPKFARVVGLLGPSVDDYFRFDFGDAPPQEWAFRLPDGHPAPPVGANGELNIDGLLIKVQVIEPSMGVKPPFGSRTVFVREIKQPLKDLTLPVTFPEGPFAAKTPEEIIADLEALKETP